MRGMKVRLVDDNKPQGATAIGTKEGGTEEIIVCKFLRGAQKEDEVAQVWANLVDAQNESVTHSHTRKLINVMSLHGSMDVA